MHAFSGMDSSRRNPQNGQVIVLVRVSGTGSRVIAVELQAAPDLLAPQVLWTAGATSRNGLCSTPPPTVEGSDE